MTTTTTATTTKVATTPMTLRQVCARVGVSRVTLMEWVRRGKFPPPLPIGLRVCLWDPEVVENALKGRPVRRR
jgi:predicted DNA-binding transcriptional regulator AlpA